MVTAHTIKNLLAKRHSGDVFVRECVTGGQEFDSGSGKGFIDAWAMPRSWSRANYIGYEIKVTRRDFMQDEKWQRYLPVCRQFYFVCAPGVCEPREVPKEAGLLLVSRNGVKLYQKVKAPTRDVDHRRLFNVLKNLAMRHGSPEDGAQQPNAEYWREWLQTREENQEIGHRVSLALSKRYREDVVLLERKQEVLENQIKSQEQEMAGLRKIRDIGRALGIRNWDTEQQIRRKLQAAQSPVPGKLPEQIQTLTEALQEVGRELETLTASPETVGR